MENSPFPSLSFFFFYFLFYVNIYVSEVNHNYYLLLDARIILPHMGHKVYCKYFLWDFSIRFKLLDPEGFEILYYR